MSSEPTYQDEPRFPSVDEFVREYLLPVAMYGDSDFRWCHQWWKHTAAVVQLDALWRSFESYTIHPDAWAMAVWWRDYYYPIWHEVTRTNGTFSKCDDATGAHEQGRLRTAETPPKMVFLPETTIAAAARAREFSDD